MSLIQNIITVKITGKNSASVTAIPTSEEYVSGQKVVKAFNKEEDIIKGFEEVNYHTFNMSAIYNLETLEVVGETPDESYTRYYLTVLDTLTVSYSEDDDISFSFTYKVTDDKSSLTLTEAFVNF